MGKKILFTVFAFLMSTGVYAHGKRPASIVCSSIAVTYTPFITLTVTVDSLESNPPQSEVDISVTRRSRPTFVHKTLRGLLEWDEVNQLGELEFKDDAGLLTIDHVEENGKTKASLDLSSSSGLPAVKGAELLCSVTYAEEPEDDTPEGYTRLDKKVLTGREGRRVYQLLRNNESGKLALEISEPQGPGGERRDLLLAEMQQFDLPVFAHFPRHQPPLDRPMKLGGSTLISFFDLSPHPMNRIRPHDHDSQAAIRYLEKEVQVLGVGSRTEIYNEVTLKRTAKGLSFTYTERELFKVVSPVIPRSSVEGEERDEEAHPPADDVEKEE